MTAFVGPATGGTAWSLADSLSEPLFAALLDAFAREVGAGPDKRVVLLLDNAGWHTLPNLVVPDGLRLVYLPPPSPQRQPAETLWTPVDEPVVDTVVPSLDKLIETVTERRRTLTTRQPEIRSRTNVARWPAKPETVSYQRRNVLTCRPTLPHEGSRNARQPVARIEPWGRAPKP